jgi:hypothetical protein
LYSSGNSSHSTFEIQLLAKGLARNDFRDKGDSS